MKSLLIVKMCNKANIFKNQLGYFRNLYFVRICEILTSCELIVRFSRRNGEEEWRGMVRRGHAGQVFILHKNFWPPLFSCTKISDPPSFSTSPPPPPPVINDRSLSLTSLIALIPWENTFLAIVTPSTYSVIWA